MEPLNQLGGEWLIAPRLDLLAGKAADQQTAPDTDAFNSSARLARATLEMGYRIARAMAEVRNPLEPRPSWPEPARILGGWPEASAAGSVQTVGARSSVHHRLRA